MVMVSMMSTVIIFKLIMTMNCWFNALFIYPANNDNVLVVVVVLLLFLMLLLLLFSSSVAAVTAAVVPVNKFVNFKTGT